MFRKRQRTGAARDVAAVVAGDDAAEVVVPRNKKPQAGAAEADRFRIGPDHQSTMSAAIASDRYVAVSTRDDDDLAQSSRAPAKANVYTGVQKEKNPFGPKKAPANLRVITRVDYQPDICKDYKETGYCGYGDSCKFLHDRGDYKSGWQIDREWEAEQQALKARGGAAADAENYEIHDGDDDDDNLPFACAICREPFTDPVVTKCMHYFCQACALKRHAAVSTKCAVCKAQTMGIFNTATALVKKLLERAAAGGDADP
ncbi:unnamed protein product (mitochondrion) [Plasmodiophora brassicae]|uniref:RING-type E3 ubiquitin transferase n=1 Tax=Plasmodiophora brassicae TaxID=37360 RepID=A0A0G4J8G1_PLABS|nr:hypothetical protein PBRA_009466 [Plasmodiophora brassicae]SPR01704.1 unnamed protein product [Plasmodiophora brassicae]